MNEGVLSEMTPDRDRMAQVYRALRDAQKQAGDGFFTASNVEVAEQASARGSEVSQESATCAIAVFRELGLIETRTANTSGEVTRSVRVVPGAAKVELENSVRYREGLDEQAIFQTFRQWALREPAEALQQQVQRPILPGCVM